jgi:hypothetical protein
VQDLIFIFLIVAVSAAAIKPLSAVRPVRVKPFPSIVPVKYEIAICPTEVQLEVKVILFFKVIVVQAFICADVK